jgi:thioesterase-3
METGVIEIKVRGYHIDLFGHVNNARYLEFLEEGRWSFFEDKIDLGGWKQRGFIFSVVNININYRRAASLGDVLEIRTWISKLGDKSGTMRQEVVLKGPETIVADADITFVTVDKKTGRAAPFMDEDRTSIEHWKKE